MRSIRRTRRTGCSRRLGFCTRHFRSHCLVSTAQTVCFGNHCLYSAPVLFVQRRLAVVTSSCTAFGCTRARTQPEGAVVFVSQSFLHAFALAFAAFPAFPAFPAFSSCVAVVVVFAASTFFFSAEDAVLRASSAVHTATTFHTSPRTKQRTRVSVFCFGVFVFFKCSVGRQMKYACLGQSVYYGVFVFEWRGPTRKLFLS